MALVAWGVVLVGVAVAGLLVDGLDGLRTAEAPADHGPASGPDAASGHAPRDFGGGAADN